MKKFVCFAAVAALFLSISAQCAPIFTYEEKIPVAKSITLTRAQSFYGDHPLTYSVLRADLSDPHTKLQLLRSPKGADILETVSSLAAARENVVGALNADFFSVFSGNTGFSLGIEIEDGTLLSSPINPSTMASVSFMDGAVDISYLDFHIMAVAPNWQYQEVRHINKHTTYYGDILLYTSDFGGGYSPAPGGEVVEVVVEDGIIKEFRRNLPPVAIPENGCVLVVSEGSTMFFANNFAVGDPIRFDAYVTPDILKADAAFGGGAKLLDNGKIPDTFSHVVAGDHPRSALGVDETGKILYLVAVDGRQAGSAGLRMRALSELMLSLGCYNAVNLDGGGSTNMVASTLWNPALHTVNTPTENRKVINAVGLTYDAPVGTPYEISVKTDKTAVFIGDPVLVSAALYDENMRPLEGEIVVRSASGTVENGVFIPKAGGNAVITAECGTAEGSASVFVVDKVAGISLPDRLSLKKGESYTLPISVFDEDGHFVKAENTLGFTFESNHESVVTISDGVITALGDGAATIRVLRDGAESFVPVTVGTETVQRTHSFAYSATAAAYPKALTEAAFSSCSLSGKAGVFGCLSYAFLEPLPEEGTEEAAEKEETPEPERSAHAVLETPLAVSDTERSLSLKVYCNGAFAHTLHARFVTDGKYHAYPFAGTLSEGWQTVTLTLPSDAPKGMQLTDIFVCRRQGEPLDTGRLYFDTLSYFADTPFSPDPVPQNVYTALQSAPAPAVSFAPWQSGNTLLSSLANAQSEKRLGKTGIFVGKDTGFSAWEDENALYMQLDTKNGGIAKTDASQWEKLKQAAEATQKKNIVLLSGASVFGTDALENRVVCDYLASLKKHVFVITRGGQDRYENRGGVHFYTLRDGGGFAPSRAAVESYRYLTLSFGETPTASFKTLFEKER